jgi:subtilisin family serine protease
LSTVGNDGYEDEHQNWCGTSMAAPHVAGAAALLRGQHPDWSAQQIVDRLVATAHDKGGAGRDNYYGYGILDAAYAVGLAPPPPPPPPPMTVTISGPTTWPAYQVVTVQALVSHGTPPLNYAWKVNGSPACGNQSWCSRAMGARGTSVYFYVTVTDHDGDQASDYHIVTAQ